MFQLDRVRVCFVGAGSMAEAIIRGMIEKGQMNPQQFVAINKQNRERLSQLSSTYGIDVAHDETAKNEAVKQADVIVLAVKPFDAKETIESFKMHLNNRQLLISVVAGLSIQRIANFVGDQIGIVRAMPNTSSTIGYGVTGVSFSSHVTADQEQFTLSMFRTIGDVYTTKESQLDVVTGISGSGPAYVYYMMEAMIEAAEAGGIPKETAKAMVVQTFLGAAQMAKLTEEEPRILREKVTSKGGTTEAALRTLQSQGFVETVKDAVQSAVKRAGELNESL